ncbi:GNAT family N-acetyltransferase [Oceanobacillus rekensis]|uniref:GNAT family N-acetyltransferase n=1 Tax=Oceanobacillus rekensis TaxID=937927 RepID=UPI000B443816|nr:GNAT family N-acetyltransferase [Oceanobacillus rekensis]
MDHIKRLSATDYDEIFTLSQFAFQYKLSEDDLIKKEEEANRHIIWGWMEGEKVAAKLHMIPLSININGKSFEMGGISSVSTWPEYRRNGMVKQLLAHALQHMRKNGQIVSYLHPFSVPFYRKFGWEIAFNKKRYTIPMDKLKRKWDAIGYVRRIDADNKLIHQIYSEVALNFNGMLTRDAKWWEQRVLTNNEMVAVCYNMNNEADGYIIYRVKDNILQVDELAYKSLNGWKLLLEFIANHDSMAMEVNMTVSENDNLPLLLDEPRFKQEITPYFMARIVDVPAFLSEYPYEKGSEDVSLAILVHDDFLPDNSGSYVIKQTNGVTEVFSQEKTVDEENVIHCTVQQLTAFMFGYKRPLELSLTGLIQGDDEAIEQLESLIPIRQTFFADFF